MANFWFLGVLLLVANASTLEHIFHNGKEYKYDYEVYSTSGALEPSSYASVFAYRGVLRIQAHDDHVIAKLDDITMANYNGHYDFNHNPEMTFVSHPELTADMSHPFKLHYKANGQVDSIGVQDEKEWATNMKKATATLLQLHTDTLQERNKVFTIDEDTIHGTCPINYEVSPCPDEPEHTKVIRKHRHNHDCHNDRVFRHRYINEGLFCPKDKLANDPTHSSSFQTYHVEHKDGHYHVKRIDVMSQTIFRPFDNAGLSQFSFVNHTIILESFGDIKDEIKLEGDVKEIADLHYHFNPVEQPKTVNDLKVSEEFFGTKVDYTLPQEKTVETIEEILNKVADSLDEHHIHKDVVKAYKSSLYIALPYASALDYDHWMSMYEHFKGASTDREETIQDLFLDLMGMTGTSPSALALLDIIKEDHVNRGHLLRLLATFSFYLQEPTELLTEQYETLLEKYSSETDKVMSYRVATLALANLASHTCRHYCSEQFLNKYIDLFYNKFEKSQHESTQLLYLSALHSIGIGSVAEKLLPVVKGKTEHSLNVRLQAIWACHGLAHEDKHKLHHEIMPIFFDQTEHYEVRIGAFGLVMQTQPNFDELQQMAVSLFNEKSLQVAHYVYTTYKAFSNINHPCYEKMAKDTSFLLKYMKYVKIFLLNPRYSGVYTFDYFDNKYHFGHVTYASVVASTHSIVPRSVYVGFQAYLGGFSTDYFSLYVRQTGLSDSIYKHLSKIDVEDLKQGDLKKVFDKLHLQPRPDHPFTLEIGVMTGNSVFAHIYIDEKSCEGMSEYFKDASKLQKNFHLNKQMAMLYLNGLYEEPTDLGTPVSILVVNTAVSSYRGNFTYDKSESTVFRDNEFDGHFISNFATIVSNYNPTTGFFHNVARHRLFTFNIPRHLRIGIDFSKKQLKFSSDVPTHEDPIEVVVHATTVVSIRTFGDHDVNEYLHQSCADCNFLDVVSKGKNTRKDLMLVDHDCDYTGQHFHVEIFDCEKKGGYGEFLRLLKRTFSSEHKSIKHNVAFTTMLGFSNLFDYFWASPSGETCGIHATYAQNKKDPTSRIEGSIRLQVQDVDDSDIIWKGGKYNIRGTLNFRGVEGKSPDHKWDVSAKFEHNKFFKHQESKIKLIRGPVEGQDDSERVLCIDYTHTTPDLPDDLLTLEGDESEYQSNCETSIVWGQSTEGKCPVDKAGIKIHGVAKRSHEQKALVKKNVWPYNQCRKDHEDKKTWPGKYTPFTEACTQAAIFQTTPLRTEIKIKHSNLPEPIRKAYRTWLTLLKTILYPYWEVETAEEHPQGDEGYQADHHGSHDSSEEHTSDQGHHGHHRWVKLPAGEIQIIRELSAVEEVADLHIHSDVEQNHFENIDYSHYSTKPLTNPNVRFFDSFELAVKLGLTAYCAVGPHYVRTLDNVTYHTDIRDCYTLVSSDCSEDPKYAVFVNSDKEHNFALRVFVGGNQFDIKDANTPTVTFNGEDHDASGKGYQYPEKDALPLFQAVHYGHSYEIFSPAFQFGVHFNGEHVYVIVPSRYRSHHCGLCGNFDSESNGELEGPNHCHLDDGKDMAYAYSLKEGDCSVPEFECHEQVHRHRRDAGFSKTLVGSLLSKLH